MRKSPSFLNLTPKRLLSFNKSHPLQQGFSLIEILVVMVIIGIILSFVIVAFGDFGASRRAAMTSEHLASLMKYARIKAIIGADTYGVDIKQDGYIFYRFESSEKTPYGEWKKLERDHIFKSNSFPESLKISLNIKTSPTQPEIIIKPSGHITPFTLTFDVHGDLFIIKGHLNGQIETTDE